MNKKMDKKKKILIVTGIVLVILIIFGVTMSASAYAPQADIIETVAPTTTVMTTSITTTAKETTAKETTTEEITTVTATEPPTEKDSKSSNEENGMFFFINDVMEFKKTKRKTTLPQPVKAVIESEITNTKIKLIIFFIFQSPFVCLI